MTAVEAREAAAAAAPRIIRDCMSYIHSRIGEAASEGRHKTRVSIPIDYVLPICDTLRRDGYKVTHYAETIQPDNLEIGWDE